MLGRVAAVAFDTAVGTVIWRDPEEEPASEGTVDFWFERPGRYRCEDSKGLVLLLNEQETLVRDSHGALQRLRPDSGGGFGWHPKYMLGGLEVVRALSGPNDFSRPTGPATPDRIGDRMCWRFVLAPPAHKPAELEVAIDYETGVVLEFRSKGFGAWTTLTTFHPDAQLPSAIFEHSGVVREDWLAEREHSERVHEWERTRDWPLPRYWPDGPEFSLNQAAEDGSFVASLDVAGERDPILARWPTDGDPPSDAQFRSRAGRHIDRWQTEGWEWALAVDSPITEDQLQAVIESIPLLDGVEVIPRCTGLSSHAPHVSAGTLGRHSSSPSNERLPRNTPAGESAAKAAAAVGL